MYRLWARRQTSGGNYRLRGAPTRHTMSLRSCCPKEACHTTADPEGCPTGKVHHYPLSPPAFASRCLGTLPYGAQTPRDTDFAELPSLGTAPVPGLGSIWPPSHGTHPTANRVRWHTREISRGACVPRVWHVPSLIWSFRQWVPVVKDPPGLGTVGSMRAAGPGRAMQRKYWARVTAHRIRRRPSSCVFVSK